jgi:hypothetical protein
MYDASLQAEYIISDPAKRKERATQYLEFEHVERRQTMTKVMSHNNALTKRLASSPLKPEGESRLEREFERVKNLFQSGNKDKVRDKWCPQNMFQIAECIGKCAEYDTFVRIFSGCTHSSAMAVKHGPIVKSNDVIVIASMIAARVAKLGAHYNQLNLGEDEQVLDAFAADFFAES